MDKLRFAYLCLGKHQNRLPNNANYLDCLFVLNLGHNPLYGHFCKCLYIEMLKISLVY